MSEQLEVFWMKYQDTIEQADDKLQKVLGFIKQHRLPASPINYSVVYEYVSGANTDICVEIDKSIRSGKTIDAFMMEGLYSEYILVRDESQDAIVKDVKNIVGNTQKHAHKAQKDTSNYITLLDEGLLLLDGADQQTSQQVVSKLLKVTTSMKGAQQILVKALKQAQSKTAELEQQIEDLEQSRQLDALTGLYNMSVMNETVDMWLSNNVSTISALSINLDHFKQFNENYGFTIGNVILSKVAQKVKSYVMDSGLPMRAGGEEFLILIPDANMTTAKEIAEKVRQGVEKLQFVNAKSKEKLPKITVSIGVSEYSEKIGLEGTIHKASSALRMAKATGRNRVFSDSESSRR